MTESIRDLKIEWGGVAFGNTSGRRIDSRAGRITMEKSAEEFRLDFNLLITAASPSAFATEVATVEEALRKPFQILKVTAGDGDANSVLYHFTHDGTPTGTDLGFDGEASISKIGDDADTAISRLYRVTISVQLPQDQITSATHAGVANPREGMRNTTVSVAYSESRRRTVTISGEWTAIGTATAREQYEAKIATRASAVLTAIGGTGSTWELIDEPSTEVDDTREGTLEQGKGNILRFVRIYQEIIFAEPGGSTSGNAILAGETSILDNPDLINQQISLSSKALAGSGISESARRLESCTVTYSAGVNKDNVTGRDMKDLWENTVRPYLMREAEFFLPTTARAVVQESPTFDLANNTIQATVEMQARAPTGFPIMGTVSVADSYTTGSTVVPIWSEHATDKYVYQGPATRTRTITITFKHFENDLPGGRGNPLPYNGFRRTQNNGFTKRHDVRFDREVVGRSGDSIFMINRVETIEIEYAAGANGAVGENIDVLFQPLGQGFAPQVGLGFNVDNVFQN